MHLSSTSVAAPAEREPRSKAERSGRKIAQRAHYNYYLLADHHRAGRAVAARRRPGSWPAATVRRPPIQFGRRSRRSAAEANEREIGLLLRPLRASLHLARLVAAQLGRQMKLASLPAPRVAARRQSRFVVLAVVQWRLAQILPPLHNASARFAPIAFSPKVQLHSLLNFSGRLLCQPMRARGQTAPRESVRVHLRGSRECNFVPLLANSQGVVPRTLQTTSELV